MSANMTLSKFPAEVEVFVQILLVLTSANLTENCGQKRSWLTIRLLKVE
jgi:hypothetical protein